eukprot:TRINITY_DN75700_c0_g1_i1.p1 TRINITY_DN75700_c0_g1~~TRINITY_DN75700_c0_g1_i1.p1  ORF type:complete len:893 (-),score=274.90 TRINITY_DN75700_c0_g1_i1:232-2757(-)
MPQAGLLDAAQSGCAERYQKQAEDEGLEQNARHAAVLMVEAESKLKEQHFEEALRLAEGALVIFRESGAIAAITDSLRLVVLAERAKGRLKEAHGAAYTQLEAFRAAGERAGEAKVLLMLANINHDKRGSRNRERAQQWALEARRYYAEIGDAKHEAQALLELVNIVMKRRGDRLQAVEETKQLVGAAVPLLRAVGDTRGEGVAMHGLACARALMGAWEAAAAAGRAALELFRKANSRHFQAFELHCIAVWLLADEDVEGAIQAAEESLDIYMQESPAANVQEAAVLQTLVRAYSSGKEFKRAVDMAQDVLERFEESGQKHGEAVALEMLALGLSQNGEVAKAAKCARRQAAVLQSIGDREGEARSLRSLCRICCVAGEHQQAIEAGREAAAISSELGRLADQAIALQLIADCHMAMESFDMATRCTTEARLLFQRAGDHSNEVSALVQASQAAQLARDHAAALEAATEAQVTARNAKNAYMEALAQRTIATIHLEAFELIKAAKAANKAVTLSRQSGDKEEELVCLVVSVIIQTSLANKDAEASGNADGAQASTKAARLEKATKLAKDAQSLAKRLGDPLSLARSLYALVLVLSAKSCNEEALEKASMALLKFQEVEDTDSVFCVYILMAKLHLSSRNFDEAKEAAESAVWLAQQIDDRVAENQGWTLLGSIKVAEEESQRPQQQQPAEVTPTLQRQEQQASQASPPVWAQQPEETASGDMPQSLSRMPDVGMMREMPKLELRQAFDRELVQGHIMKAATDLMGDQEDIDPDMPLMDYGLTSAMAVILRDLLSTMLPGIHLPVTLIFDYPSVNAISDLVVDSASKVAKKAAASSSTEAAG